MMPPAVAALARAPVVPDPPNQTIARCLSLMRTGRLREAGPQIALLPEGSLHEQAWKLYLQARLHAERGDFASAKSVAQTAAARALQIDLSSESTGSGAAIAAAALELQGLALRRLDEPEQGLRLHAAAHALRTEHDLWDGQCESATSIGLCTQQMGQSDRAAHWFSKATTVHCADAPGAARKAVSQFHLSSILQRQLHHSEAIEMAQSAQALLAKFFPGELMPISARLCVTRGVIRQAEQLLADEDRQARTMLNEILASLQSTRDELSAFGAIAKPDVHYCDELLDFVQRLRSLASGLE